MSVTTEVAHLIYQSESIGWFSTEIHSHAVQWRCMHILHVYLCISRSAFNLSNELGVWCCWLCCCRKRNCKASLELVASNVVNIQALASKDISNIFYYWAALVSNIHVSLISGCINIRLADSHCKEIPRQKTISTFWTEFRTRVQILFNSKIQKK